MKRLFTAIVGLCLIATTALAFYQSRDSNYNSTFVSGGGGGYVGPGNLTLTGTLVKYWGWSCVTAAYSGNAIDLADAATGNTTGTRLQCSSGVLVALVSASACTFVTGNACSTLAVTCAISCVVVTKYEQIGTADCAVSVRCDLTQATNANRPTYTATGGAGGKACEAYIATQTLVTTAATTINQPFSLGTLDSRTGGTASLSNIFETNATFSGVYHSGTAANVQIYAGGLSANVAATDNAFHALQTVFNGASSIIAVDGSGTTVSPGTNAWGTDVLATGNGSGGSFIGVNCEEMVFSGANSGADNTALSANQHTRFGF